MADLAERILRLRQSRQHQRQTGWARVKLENPPVDRSKEADRVALGFVGDVGDLAKLVQAASGVREIPEWRAQLAHELADCLWSVLVLADQLEVDIERAFSDTMAQLAEHVRSQASV